MKKEWYKPTPQVFDIKDLTEKIMTFANSACSCIFSVGCGCPQFGYHFPLI